MRRKSIFEYLKDQPRLIIDKIYKSSSNIEFNQSQYACKAIFQSLSTISKCFVMKLLFINQRILLKDILEWSSKDSIQMHSNAVEELVSLRILMTDENDVDDFKISLNDLDIEYQINPYFQSSLQQSLLYPMEPWSLILHKNDLSIKKPTREELDNYSTNKWNEILSYIVNLIPLSSFPTNILYIFVKRTNIMTEGITSNGKKGMIITAKGYEFMLKDYLGQVWDFVLETIKYSKSQEESLSLLFMLSYCTFGRGYPLDALTKIQRQLIFEFSQVGIIYLESYQATHFYPTRIALNMIFGNIDMLQNNSSIPVPDSTISFNMNNNSNYSNNLPTINEEEEENNLQALKIIIETNNQVIAYLTNDIHFAMLQLFIDIQIRMPNMIIGKITKEKARQAFKIGITVIQIIDFLTLHAHPKVRYRNPIIPENVTDQLTIWEAENHLIQTQEAIIVDLYEIFDDFPRSEYQILVDNLQHSNNVLLWRNDEKMLLGVTIDGFSMIQSYIDSHRS